MTISLPQDDRTYASRNEMFETIVSFLGGRVAEALKLTNQAVAEALDGLPPVKMHCSMLAEQAIHAAVKDYVAKHPEEAAKENINVD